MTASVQALLIVDAQCGLLEGDHAVPNAPLIVERLAALLASARAANALIIHLQNDGAPGSLDEPNTPGWLIHPRLNPQGSEPVIRKTDDDGFVDTPLESVLSGNGVERIAIAGLLSEMCVSATTRGALARGLKTVLVTDAHATYNLDDIPASIVSRVAEHALGDEIVLATVSTVRFEPR